MVPIKQNTYLDRDLGHTSCIDNILFSSNLFFMLTQCKVVDDPTNSSHHLPIVVNIDYDHACFASTCLVVLVLKLLNGLRYKIVILINYRHIMVDELNKF